MTNASQTGKIPTMKVTTFYQFVSLSEERLAELQSFLTQLARRLNISGLIVLAREGCNATISGPPDSIKEFKLILTAEPEFTDLQFKDSEAGKHPFKRFKVDVRNEIVTIGKDDIKPGAKNGHLSPEQWHKLLQSRKDMVLLDTRNVYETNIGKFKGALDPLIAKFNEFPEFVQKSGLKKDTKILMYCTGGIRCEKAAIEMQNQGFKNVFQLDGGILKYLEEYPEGEFEGECFVFDHRVALDKNLKSSRRYRLCPHCGNPGDQVLDCLLCENETVICRSCREDESLNSCSKNCAYHLRKASSRSA